VISDAERVIGYKLFERAHGRLQPVPEAQYFLDRSQEILEKMNDLENFMRHDSHHFSQIRIACMPVLSEFFMPRKIAEFSKKNADIRFFMRAQTSSRVLESIASQQFDIGFAEQAHSSNLYSTTDFKMGSVVALRADHSLAKKRILTAADLSGEPFVTFLPHHNIRKGLQAAFDDAGATLNIPFSLQNGAAQYAIVESGQAVGFMSLLNVWLYQQVANHQPNDEDLKIVFRPFVPIVQQNISLIIPRHRPLSQISQQFAHEVEESLNNILSLTKRDFQLEDSDFAN
jgi:DNA-binding transcriptional LysR family regulator